MKTLRTAVLAILDKMDQLLQAEPARVIGYGAAVIVYLVARVMADKGLLDVRMTFDQSVTAAGAAITTLVIIIESIRRFVYSPLTYIEDLSDESQAAHEAAHLEEQMQAWVEAVKAKLDAEAAAKETPKVGVPIGSVKASGAKDQTN